MCHTTKYTNVRVFVCMIDLLFEIYSLNKEGVIRNKMDELGRVRLTAQYPRRNMGLLIESHFAGKMMLRKYPVLQHMIGYVNDVGEISHANAYDNDIHCLYLSN